MATASDYNDGGAREALARLQDEITMNVVLVDSVDPSCKSDVVGMLWDGRIEGAPVARIDEFDVGDRVCRANLYVSEMPESLGGTSVAVTAFVPVTRSAYDPLTDEITTVADERPLMVGWVPGFRLGDFTATSFVHRAQVLGRETSKGTTRSEPRQGLDEEGVSKLATDLGLKA